MIIQLKQKDFYAKSVVKNQRIRIPGCVYFWYECDSIFYLIFCFLLVSKKKSLDEGVFMILLFKVRIFFFFKLKSRQTNKQDRFDDLWSSLIKRYLWVINYILIYSVNNTQFTSYQWTHFLWSHIQSSLTCKLQYIIDSFQFIGPLEQ